MPTENDTIEVDIHTVEKQAPDLATALGQLEQALASYNELQTEILPLQEKGLVVPNLAQRVHSSHQKIARAMDGILPLLRKHESNEAVIAVAMGAYQEGMLYMQAILFGIHYSRVSSRQSPFQHLLREAYHLIEKQQQRLVSG